MGTIVAVEERPVRNRWTTELEVQDVIVFEGGMQLVLNRGIRLELIDRFGSESDYWVGRSIAIGTRAIQRKGQASWERFLFEPGVEVDGSGSVEFNVDEFELPGSGSKRR